MSARKVPFEECTRWRKVCGRSAKDQIGDSIYSFLLRFRAKGSRKARERCAKDVSPRAMSCPKWAAFSHAWYWPQGKEATYHNDILVASIHSCKQQPIYCIVCIRVCLIPYIWFLIRILDFGKCNPYGTAKGGERFAKDLRKGGSWELLFSTTPIYMYYDYIDWCRISSINRMAGGFRVTQICSYQLGHTKRDKQTDKMGPKASYKWSYKRPL